MSPRIAVGPGPWNEVIAAVRAAGGEPAVIGPDADALVWLDAADLDGLTRALAAAPAARWVQLPFAGVELVAGAGLLDPARTWTCAKGAYAEPVAEHALMLALAGLRLLRRRTRASSWGAAAGESLYDQPVTILGGGGIAARLMELLAPMRAQVTVVRRQSGAVPGAARTLRTGQLAQALAERQGRVRGAGADPGNRAHHRRGGTGRDAARRLAGERRARPACGYRCAGRCAALAVHRRGSAGRDRPRAAARWSPAVGPGQRHHHPAHSRHPRDDPAGCWPRASAATWPRSPPAGRWRAWSTPPPGIKPAAASPARRRYAGCGQKRIADRHQPGYQITRGSSGARW